jgi:hypothetical protein
MPAVISTFRDEIPGYFDYYEGEGRGDRNAERSVAEKCREFFSWDLHVVKVCRCLLSSLPVTGFSHHLNDPATNIRMCTTRRSGSGGIREVRNTKIPSYSIP